MQAQEGRETRASGLGQTGQPEVPKSETRPKGAPEVLNRRPMARASSAGRAKGGAGVLNTRGKINSENEGQPTETGWHARAPSV